MADNVEANAGSGGATFAADDIGGVYYPRAKVVWGADGAVNDTSAAAPMPVVQTGTLALPTGAATEATLASALTALQTIDNIVSGNEAQVDVITLPAIPAGNNNIGDVDVASIAAGDNNIGNVDVVTLPALPAGTNNIGDVDVLTLPALPAGNNNIGDVDIASVPAPLSTTGGGTEATALRVTIATDSTGVLSIDDNGSSITVDGTVTVTDGSGSLTVDGTVTVQDGGNVISVDDASGSLTVDQVATASSISAKLATDAMMNNLTAVTPKFAIIDAASSGDNTLVSAVASNKIRVLAAYLVAAGTVNVRFESGAGGTALSGQMNLVANSGFVLPFNPVGWFETGVNTLLNLELSGAVSVDGSLVYIEVA